MAEGGQKFHASLSVAPHEDTETGKEEEEQTKLGKQTEMKMMKVTQVDSRQRR